MGRRGGPSPIRYMEPGARLSISASLGVGSWPKLAEVGRVGSLELEGARIGGGRSWEVELDFGSKFELGAGRETVFGRV